MMEIAGNLAGRFAKTLAAMPASLRPRGCGQKNCREEVAMMDFYAEAIHSFQENLDWDRVPRAKRLAGLAFGQRPSSAGSKGYDRTMKPQEECRKSFARSDRPLAGQHPCSLVSKT